MSSAAEAGMGICLLPDYVAAPALQRGSLVRLLPNFRLPEKHIHALYPSRRFLDAKVKTWVDFLKQELPQALTGYHDVLQNREYWARGDDERARTVTHPVRIHRLGQYFSSLCQPLRLSGHIAAPPSA